MKHPTTYTITQAYQLESAQILYVCLAPGVGSQPLVLLSNSNRFTLLNDVVQCTFHFADIVVDNLFELLQVS
jgi:hypothetical protein